MASVRKTKRIVKMVASFLVFYIMLVYLTFSTTIGINTEVGDNEWSQFHYSDGYNTGINNNIESHRKSLVSKLRRIDNHGICLNVSINSTLLLSDQQWHTVSNEKPIVHVYAAYFDKMASEVKIMSASKGNPRLYCHLWFRTGENVTLQIKKSKPNLVPEVHGKRFAPYIISCPVRRNPTKILIPTYVSLVQEKCSTADHLIPIQVRPDPFQPKYNFTVCVTPMNRNYSNLGEFLEFMEVNAMFGADHFVFYNHSIGDILTPFIKSYVADGLVSVLDWDIPIPTLQGPIDEIHYFGQLVALNDCLYRSRLTSRYTAFIDLDEIIVPMRENNWKTIIDNINLKNPTVKYSTYVFPNVFFRKEWSKSSTFARHPLVEEFELRTLLYTKREVKTWPHRQRSKYIVDPYFVQVAGIHYPWKISYDSIAIKEQDAILYHYRNWENYEEAPFLEEPRMFHFNNTVLDKISGRLAKARTFSV